MPFPNLQKHQQIERFGLFTTTPVFESISKCPQTDSKTPVSTDPPPSVILSPHRGGNVTKRELSLRRLRQTEERHRDLVDGLDRLFPSTRPYPD